jgi:hypothetical protein
VSAADVAPAVGHSSVRPYVNRLIAAGLA